MHSPMVSVIIPVYNISSYLPRCLSSLLRQTLSDIEILCVDDASTDDSVQVIKEFQAKDSRIRLLQQPHQGVSVARNLGILQAGGKYISFVDGDDWVEDDMLGTMLARAEETACDMVVCSAEVQFERQNVRSLRSHRSLQAALTVLDDVWEANGRIQDLWSLVNRPGSWPFIWNKLIRSDLIKENAVVFSPSLPLGEDGVFLQLLFQYSGKVVFCSKALYHYRYQRKASATDNLFQSKVIRFQLHIEVVSVMLREFSGRDLLAKNGRYLLRWILSFLYSDFISLPATNRQSASVTLKNLFIQYELTAYSDVLSHIEQKRLQNMLETTKTCTEAKRIFEFVQTKVENRVVRFFSSK